MYHNERKVLSSYKSRSLASKCPQRISLVSAPERDVTPIPKTLKNLRGFLGLTGYYRKFVQNYGRIETPLTTLTKKDSFSWTQEATKSFEQIKELMCKAPVLTTLDFTKTFIVECDASGNGIGAVLMQEGRPLAFESRPLKGKDLHKPIYEKEMMEILHACLRR
jgi:hypothetical protein